MTANHYIIKTSDVLPSKNQVVCKLTNCYSMYCNIVLMMSQVNHMQRLITKEHTNLPYFEWLNLRKQIPAKHFEKNLRKWKDQVFKTVKY